MRLLLPFCFIATSAVLAGPVPAQDHAASPGAEQQAPTLIHGNYCGLGNRGLNVRPTDALDAACRRHDLCFPSEGLPTCRCNAQLRLDAYRVALDPRQPGEVRDMAQIVSDAAGLIACDDRAVAPRVRVNSSSRGSDMPRDMRHAAQ